MITERSKNNDPNKALQEGATALVMGRSLIRGNVKKMFETYKRIKVVESKNLWLKSVRDVQLCIDLGVNLLGFVFYKNPKN